MSIISEKTKVRLSIVVFLFVTLSTSLMWVGAIQADVSKLKEERITDSQKLDMIQKDTQYMRGILDTMLNKK